jgi:uncharacterized protein (DUF4213/DUF364 family)
MSLLSQVIETLPDGEVERVDIGYHWTCVQVQVNGQTRCGLASTLKVEHNHSQASLPQAGELQNLGGLELAGRALSAQGPMASVALAAINALLPRQPERWVDINAEQIIAQYGDGKTVAMVGRFPFADRLQARVGELKILERRPQPGDFPAEAAPDIIPAAAVVAITGMTVANGSLENLLSLCRPESLVILLGPTTPLSPILFEYGVDILAGAIVEKPVPVLHALHQGGNFRQLHKAGVRLVTITAPGLSSEPAG